MYSDDLELIHKRLEYLVKHNVITLQLLELSVQIIHKCRALLGFASHEGLFGVPQRQYHLALLILHPRCFSLGSVSLFHYLM